MKARAATCHPENKHFAKGLCEPCYKAAHHAANKVKYNAMSAAYRVANKEAVAVRQAAYYVENVDKVRAYNAGYYLANETEIRAATSLYGKAHRVERNVREGERRRTDLNFRLATDLRKRLCRAIRNGQKTGSAVRDLGCSIDELKTHLERQFVEGMSWENWGKGDGRWHIDHIKPLGGKGTNLADRAQFLALNNFMNLQPLWEKDNLAKGAR